MLLATFRNNFFLAQNWKMLQIVMTLYCLGDNVTELRVKFLKKIEDTVPPGDD